MVENKLLKLYKKAEAVKTRKKAQKLIKKFDKKVQGESLRWIGGITPKPLANTENSAFL